MNILKHMEAVFVATLALAGSTAYLIDTLPSAQANNMKAAAAPADRDMAVVTVTARRMTAQEKQQSLKNENTVASRHAPVSPRF